MHEPSSAGMMHISDDTGRRGSLSRSSVRHEQSETIPTGPAEPATHALGPFVHSFSRSVTHKRGPPPSSSLIGLTLPNPSTAKSGSAVALVLACWWYW